MKDDVDSSVNVRVKPCLICKTRFFDATRNRNRRLCGERSCYNVHVAAKMRASRARRNAKEVKRAV